MLKQNFNAELAMKFMILILTQHIAVIREGFIFVNAENYMKAL